MDLLQPYYYPFNQEPEYIIITLGDTSKESFEKALELYNQKRKQIDDYKDGKL